MEIRVLHHREWLENSIRIDRGTEWGNPFVMRSDTIAERKRVCDLYEQYAIWRLSVEPDWLEPLRGKHLICWCAPRRCHGDTLLRLANPHPKEAHGE